MPPKAKFSRDEIVRAAFDIVRGDGMEALTARALASSLKSSARPIFTVFSSMEEVGCEVLCEARRLYAGYVERGLQDEIPFRGVGASYIRFALDEPRLFHILFMSEQKLRSGVDSVLPLIEESYEQILRSAQDGYALDRESAEGLYRHMWIYTHGIATLCATGVCTFTEEDINGMMSEVCLSLIKKMKAGDKCDRNS